MDQSLPRDPVSEPTPIERGAMTQLIEAGESPHGRVASQRPILNQGDDGRPLFDAFLLDDAGGGLWLPTLNMNGKDTLFVGDDKARFRPQIDLTHQLYTEV